MELLFDFGNDSSSNEVTRIGIATKAAVRISPQITVIIKHFFESLWQFKVIVSAKIDN